jgi:hypothetical protein
MKFDLGAEQLVAAEKATEKIAVEIKSFAGTNDLDDLYHAIGLIWKLWKGKCGFKRTTQM